MAHLNLSTVIVLICAVTALCFPSKPLNERSPELAWQAWLLVEDQNQNARQSEGDNTLRRRITPKSVFIAPIFSPEKLPPCAEGYASDPMGRCMKIFKVDEDAHLDFLLQKIKDQFGDENTADYDYEDEGNTPGPFQVNIPLGEDDDSTISEEETDMAIVVAPTNVNFNEDSILKFESKRQNKVDSSTTTTQKPKDIVNRNFEMTTTKPDVTMQTDATTTSDITSTTDVTPSNFDVTSTVTMETTTTDAPTTVTEAYATEEYVTGDGGVTEIDVTTTVTPESEALTENLDDFTLTSTVVANTTEEVTTKKSENAEKIYEATTKRIETATKSFQIKFPDDLQLPEASHQFVRFPDTPVNLPLHQSPVKRDQSFYPSPVLVPPPQEGAATHQERSLRDFPNHRNRDRSLFQFPTRWDANSKPIVFRFSRKNSYVDTSKFKQPDFYRALPSSDLSYIFGFKNRRHPSNR